MTDKVEVKVEAPNPLIEYRVERLEEGQSEMREAHAVMSRSLAEIVSEIKVGKWIVGIMFGIMQPVIVALLIKYLGE